MKLFAKEQTHMLTAETTIANKHIHIKVINKGPDRANILKLFDNNWPLIFPVDNIYISVINIDTTFNIAVTMAQRDTAMYFPITNSKFEIGSVNKVSNVPLSFSPAMESIAGYMAPKSTPIISIRGRI